MTGGNLSFAIDQGLFTMAFGRDVDYHDMVAQLTYLDRHTGEVLWCTSSEIFGQYGFQDKRVSGSIC